MINGAVATRRILLGDDYDDWIRRGQVTGSGTITHANGIVTMYSPSDLDKAYLVVNLFLGRGAIVEVTCEAKQNDAYMGGRIGIDMRADGAAVGGSNVDYIEMDTRDWKPYKMVFTADPLKPYASVSFGQWKTGLGGCSFRNIAITIYNTQDRSPEVRGCMIRKSSTGDWYIDDNFDRFATFGIKKLTVLSDRIHVDFIPIESWYRPLVFAQCANYGSGKYYTIKPENNTKDGVDLFIYLENATSGAALAPSAAGECFISLMLFTL